MQRVGAEEIMLHPLGRGDVAAMVQAIFDSQAPIKDELLDLVVSLTEGIPFFVEEILKALVEAGDIFYADGRWEHKSALSLHILRSAQDAVGQRVEQLSPEGRHVLTLAAVAGQRFDFSLLHELTQLDEGTLLTCIKGLTAAQLLTEASAEQFAFRHALTRQAISGQLLTLERKQFHRRIAETMERPYAPTRMERTKISCCGKCCFMWRITAPIIAPNFCNY